MSAIVKVLLHDVIPHNYFEDCNEANWLKENANLNIGPQWEAQNFMFGWRKKLYKSGAYVRYGN
jgi:hypothetical protein